jgi:hypothetical protein
MNPGRFSKDGVAGSILVTGCVDSCVTAEMQLIERSELLW